MAAKTTEQLHAFASGLDARPLAEVARILADGQIEAAQAVLAATTEISIAAEYMAKAIEAGGVLHYTAAGSSGLMAAADAQELGGTFSIRAEQLRIHMAGGLPTGVEMPGDVEDAVADLDNALAGVDQRDVMIAVSASGSTPYTLAAARMAKDKGATVIAIANNPATPLLKLADVPILLETPPEVLSGSTRMGAGTAQKITLNMLSTLMAIELGHVHDGMMVNLLADNAKLRTRASGIVQTIAAASEPVAIDALKAADGHVKSAVLIAARGLSADEAQATLNQAKGRLRVALASDAS